ncbi:hypothetical protein C8J57DRAFT_1575063 [Mycena rebaudengoi]|nr:hypothetical protein C8J57DRAFT_1575063 [Mycena rebaudengoi]
MTLSTTILDGSPLQAVFQDLCLARHAIRQFSRNTISKLNLIMERLIDAFIAWLNDSAIPAVSEQGRVLADDVRGVLDSYRTLNANKNGDNLVQEIVWHLTEGDVNAAVDAPNVDKEEVSSASMLPLLADFASFTRLGLADVAEIVEDQAGRTKEGLRNVEQDVEDSARDNLGRDKGRLDAEQGDPRTTFEHRMNTLKDTGSTAIGAHQSAKARRRICPSRRPSACAARIGACERAQITDPQYRTAISAVLDTAEKWTLRALDADANAPLKLDALIANSMPAQALSLIRFADAVREPGKKAEARRWVEDAFAHARRSLEDPDYARSDEASTAREELGERRRALVAPDMPAGRTYAELTGSARAFGGALAADADAQRVKNAYTQLGADAARGFAEAGKEAALNLEVALWFWRDAVAVYLPRALALLKGLPIPRTEYVDDEVELVLEKLDVSSLRVNPAHIALRSTTDVDVRTADGAEATTGVGTHTQILVDAVQLALQDVSFFYKDKHHTCALPVAPRTFTGLLTLTLPPEGLTADVALRLLPPGERAARKRFHAPVFKREVRGVLARAALEGADAVAWDVRERAGVFGDAGRGAALVGAVWSEAGKLIRQRSVAVSATGTGVVVVAEGGEKGQEGGEKRIAMGAEPQVLPGSKHGPAGTGSTSVEERVDRAQGQGQTAGGRDVAAEGQGLVGEGTRQVRSFRRSVDEQKAREKSTPGWQSSAFDL